MSGSLVLGSSSVALEEFALLFTDNAMVLGIEDIPLLLGQLTDGFVPGDPIRSKLSPAASVTGHQFCRIYLVLTDVELFLLVDICNALLF